MARKKKPITPKMIQEEKDRIGNPNRGIRKTPLTAEQEKLHNQMRKQRKSIIAERNRQSMPMMNSSMLEDKVTQQKPKPRRKSKPKPKQKI